MSFKRKRRNIAIVEFLSPRLRKWSKNGENSEVSVDFGCKIELTSLVIPFSGFEKKRGAESEVTRLLTETVDCSGTLKWSNLANTETANFALSATRRLPALSTGGVGPLHHKPTGLKRSAIAPTGDRYGQVRSGECCTTTIILALSEPPLDRTSAEHTALDLL